MNREKLEKIVQICPSTIQKSIQRENFNAFIHYGLNTFVGKEWSDGSVSPQVFNPSAQDVEQWVKVLKYAGAKGIIFTAKHHDGFCMWQTKTTEYSIKNSPYKNGNVLDGNVKAEEIIVLGGNVIVKKGCLVKKIINRSEGNITVTVEEGAEVKDFEGVFIIEKTTNSGENSDVTNGTWDPDNTTWD